MRQLLFCAFTCLTFLSFTSCKKDNSTTPLTPGTNDSTLLKLFVKLDTLHPASLDTLYKMEFGYDNSKRLTSYTLTFYDTATGVLTETANLALQYHNNDTLPYNGIFKGHQYDPTYEYSSTFNYYFGNGKLSYMVIYDTNNPQDSIISKIIYRGDSDITITYTYPLGTYYDTSYHKAIFTNDNVVQNVTTYSYVTSPGREGIYTFNNLFDTHENPFNRISFVFQLLSNSLPYEPQEDGSFTRLMAMSKNNIVQSKFNHSTYSFSEDNNYSKTYFYNNGGLPVTASYSKLLNTPYYQSYAGRELYFYTK